jgi:hypothetical protein
LHNPRAPKPIALNVGITGHRASVLTAPLVESLEPVVDEVFRQLRQALLEIQEAEEAFDSNTPASLRLHTPLATGADQIAAKSARSSGYFVRAVLPFEPDEYRKDFAPGEELDEFERALDAADEILALPGDRDDAQGAYVLVGELLIEEADVLVAIWDGEEGHGPGGTAHVVELALRSSVPVIHIDINRGSDEVRMRALVGGDATEPVDAALRDTEAYSGLLRDALKLGMGTRGLMTFKLGASDKTAKRS